MKRFEDGINYDCNLKEGLYFIGETHFNPFTFETFYWVKIGCSVNLKKRMKSYNSQNPMAWRIDYLETDIENEDLYHEALEKIAIAKGLKNEEWFLVDRITYLEMCEKGFDYFKILN